MGNSKPSRAKNDSAVEPKSTLVLSPVPMTSAARADAESGAYQGTNVENVDAERDTHVNSRHAEQSEAYYSGADTARA